MTTSIPIIRIRACAVVAATLPAALLAAVTPHALAADPPAATLTATLDVRGDSGGRDVVVTVEPDLGRVEVSPYYWPSDDGGRYLHVGLGTRADGACHVSTWVVADTTDLTASAAYDAAGAPLAETDQFTVPSEWADHVARIGIEPFGPVDCVRASSYHAPDPAHPGPRIWRSRARDLRSVGFTDVPGSFPVSVTCPRSVQWGEELDLAVEVRSAPGAYPPAGAIPQPSHLEAIDVTLDPGAFTVTEPPALPADVDLWTDPSWHGAFVLQPDTAEVYGVRLAGTITRDGATTDWTCGTVPVSMPVPTDWVGSLAGTTWWRRDTSSNSGIGSYQLHRTYEFLDGSWVFVSGEYAGARAEPCVTVKHRWPEGCHRYYYDEATGQLQIDDRRAKPDPVGWRLPQAGNRFVKLDRTHVVRPAAAGRRFSYSGSGVDGDLGLRRDGTYRYHGWDPDGVRKVTWTGRYRFTGGDAQQLVLRHGGHAFRDEVQLYFTVTDGHRTLTDLDTHHRHFRFRS